MSLLIVRKPNISFASKEPNMLKASQDKLWLEKKKKNRNEGGKWDFIFPVSPTVASPHSLLHWVSFLLEKGI